MRSVRISVNGAVARHMTGTSANTTNDVRSEVALFRTIILAMTDPTTVLANLVFVVAEGTVEGCEFAELVPLVVILTFGSGCRLVTTISGSSVGRQRENAPFQ